LSRIKTLKGPRVRRISRVEKEKVYGGNDLPKSQVLSSEWKTERVRKDASGDSEDGEDYDDELPCVIGGSKGDCIWQNKRPWAYTPDLYPHPATSIARTKQTQRRETTTATAAAAAVSAASMYIMQSPQKVSPHKQKAQKKKIVLLLLGEAAATSE